MSRPTLVPGALAASDTQPSRKPERARPARTTLAEDTAADTPRPRGVGGHPTYLDGEEILPGAGSPLPYIGLFGSAIVGLLTAGLWVTGLLAILTALLVAACVLSGAIVVVTVVVVVERFFPRVPDQLAAVLAGRDELRVRDELYRPGRLIEVSTVAPPVASPSCSKCASRAYHQGLCVFHFERSLDDRYEITWDEPEF